MNDKALIDRIKMFIKTAEEDSLKSGEASPDAYLEAVSEHILTMCKEQLGVRVGRALK